MESTVLCRFTDSGLQEILIQRVISLTNALAVAFIRFETGDVHSVYEGMAVQLCPRISCNYHPPCQKSAYCLFVVLKVNKRCLKYHYMQTANVNLTGPFKFHNGKII